MAANDPVWEKMPGMREFADKHDNSLVMVVVKSVLVAICESDEYAIKNASREVGANDQSSSMLDAANTVAREVFQEVVIPALEDEINNGITFAETRQMYHSQIAGVWFKETVKGEKGLNDRYGAFVNCNAPGKFTIKGYAMTELNAKRENREGTSPGCAQDNVRPDNPAFNLPDNAEFYDRYIRLYRRGLYRVVRSEAGDEDEGLVNRVYFSGAIDSRSLRVECVSAPEILRLQGL